MASTYAEAPLAGFEHLVRCRWVSTTDASSTDSATSTGSAHRAASTGSADATRSLDVVGAAASAAPPTVTGFERRVPPDGCADIHVDQDGRARVIGTMTQAITVAPGRPGDRLWALRLRPEAVRAVLGVPAHELLDRTLPLEDLVGRRAADDLARFVVDPDHGRPGDDRLLRDATVDPGVARAADLLWATSAVDVATVADQAWLSTRHLRRRLLDDVGLGPKLLQRIGRLHRFIDLLDRSARTDGPGPALAVLATTAGYADQAHANRDVRDLAGTTPARLAAERRAALLAP